MKIELKNANQILQTIEVTSIILTLSNGETLEMEEVEKCGPVHLSAGVNVWGGRLPEPNASLDTLKAASRTLGMYPLAANVVHLFPLIK
ncbi:hypothetical protein K3G69_04560 [Phytobacter diazotrophicus]|uniref:hypothetical protein n=1 Tax=Phytobacter diazotrophicus TaxID=395631 RepID=UPI001C9A0C1F|nr:hypothetical protein [Phytobacter diazotrophicus]MBY6255772.1 hypothetical protein [Phytobacter diazotrophicus]